MAKVKTAVVGEAGTRVVMVCADRVLAGGKIADAEFAVGPGAPHGLWIVGAHPRCGLAAENQKPMAWEGVERVTLAQQFCFGPLASSSSR